MLARFATRIDTWNGARLAKRFKSGWPATTRADVHFHRTPLAQYRYRLREPEKTSGKVHTIVFMADAPVTLERYDALLDLLAIRYRVIVFEAAGMGFSAPDPSHTFAFQRTNDDVASFVESVGGEGSILAFPCVAGLGAVDIAVRHPRLVSGLFLLQTADWDTMLKWKKRNDTSGMLARPVLGQIAMKYTGAKSAPGWFKHALGRRDHMAPFCNCAKEAFEHGAQFALASTFQRYIDGPSPLGTPKQPVAVVWGECDASHERAGPHIAHALAPQATFHALKHVGHFPDLQDPQTIADLLDEYIEQNLT
ncbi:MAG: alpha/beta hydrolase [Pseudomonadota bacterium]